jgi:hypothetical protein
LYYTIYKITNKLDGKTYIGKHQTTNLDDGYMGSGKLLRRAIEKYGIQNFTKEILFVFDTELKMNTKEIELVNEEYLKTNTYNLCLGGQGGWGFVNKEIWPHEKRLEHNRKYSGFRNGFDRTKYTEAYRLGGKMLSEWRRINKPENGFLGKQHTEETKRQISERMKLTLAAKKSKMN